MQGNDSTQDVLKFPKIDDPSRSPHENLLILLEFVKRWDSYPTEGLKSLALELFLDWLTELYFGYFQDHLDEAQEIGRHYRDLLNSLQKPIDDIVVEDINSQLVDSCSETSEYWERACYVRTNMEVFHTMFSNILEGYDGSEFKELNEFMKEHREYAMTIRSKDRPKNIPKTHWWWFYEWT